VRPERAEGGADRLRLPAPAAAVSAGQRAQSAGLHGARAAPVDHRAHAHGQGTRQHGLHAVSAAQRPHDHQWGAATGGGFPGRDGVVDRLALPALCGSLGGFLCRLVSVLWDPT